MHRICSYQSQAAGVVAEQCPARSLCPSLCQQHPLQPQPPLCAPPWAPSVPIAGVLGSVQLLLGSAAHANSPSAFFSLQLKSFHNELLTQLEQKVELDSRYLSVSDPLVCSCSSLPCTGHACAMLRGVPRPPDVSPTQTAVFSPSVRLPQPRLFSPCLLVAMRLPLAAALQQLRAFSSRPQAALKKYQTEQRSKGDSLDKCQAELKKLRKKSQGSKNPQKYSDKELQVGAAAPCRVPAFG